MWNTRCIARGERPTPREVRAAAGRGAITAVNHHPSASRYAESTPPGLCSAPIQNPESRFQNGSGAHLALWRVLALGIVLAAPHAAPADESVVNSKHDLSAFGPGPIRATEESRVCVFCHAPHNASPAAPLWNRHNPTTHYRIYRSDTTDARIDQPGPSSKMCLSCHDGGIALGLTLDRPPTEPIPMSHMFMPTGPSNLTTDLSDDHPVGFRFDRALANRDHQLRSPDLVDHRIQLGERDELECVACHEPHNNELGNFLRVTDRTGALCITCHELDGWRLSAHALSPKPVPAAVTEGERLPYLSMYDNACRSCHLAHSAPWREQLLYDRPSQLCIKCHDGLSGQDIGPLLNQRSGHRVNFLSRRPLRDEPLRRPGRGVECTDCHNPHAASGSPIQETLLGGRSQVVVPPEMQFVSGVGIAGGAVENAAFYYEVCFKCHGDAPVLIPNRTLRQRDTLGNIRREFLPTAASAHPVAFPARNIAEVPSLLPQVRSRAYIGCQDCHNNPDSVDEGGTQVAGPHGSRFDFLLVARYETADFTIESPRAYDLCYRCHDRNSILGDQSFAFHRRHIVDERTPCSACHAPHGVSGDSVRHSHLINFDLSIVGGRRLFQDTGRFSGSCTLTCHGVNHVNFTYAP